MTCSLSFPRPTLSGGFSRSCIHAGISEALPVALLAPRERYPSLYSLLKGISYLNIAIHISRSLRCRGVVLGLKYSSPFLASCSSHLIAIDMALRLFFIIKSLMGTVFIKWLQIGESGIKLNSCSEKFISLRAD